MTVMTTNMNMTTMTTITATGSNCNNTIIAALPASSSSSSLSAAAVAAPCNNNNSVMMNSMQRRLLLLLIVVIMTAMTTTTTTAFSPQSSSLKRRNGAIAFRSSSSGSSSSSSSSVNSKTTTTTGRTATVVNMSSSGQQDQQHHHNMITPMDGENAFQYLDPLKQFPSNELQEKLEKHNAMIDHLALCPSTSQQFASLPPSDCFIGGNSNSNNNMSRRPLVEHSAGLLLPPSSSSTSATSSSATNDGSSSSSSSSLLSSSHFQSHRKDLGWYNAAENENKNIPTTTTTDVVQVQMYHCDFDFFEFQKLTSKGPRKNSDIGTPEDYARPLCKDIPTSKSTTNSNINSDSISCGSWYCTKGGWPSKTPRVTTEIFYVWSGFGCVTDLDGQRNYFSPGDTVILPKNWSGRWDIAENVHKVWFVHDHHEDTATTSSSVAGSTTTPSTTPSTIIRAKIIHYNELVSTTKKEELIIEPNTKVITKSIYNSSGGEGPTNVMMSTSGPSSFVIRPNQHTNCFHILEGSMMIILEDNNNENGNGNGNNNKHQQIAVNVGDTIVLPIGWTGRFNVKETIKVLRVKV